MSNFEINTPVYLLLAEVKLQLMKRINNSCVLHLVILCPSCHHFSSGFTRNLLFFFFNPLSSCEEQSRAAWCTSNALYLFQLPLYLHRPLHYWTPHRVLDLPDVGVHVVQSQHLAHAGHPVHRRLGHGL